MKRIIFTAPLLFLLSYIGNGQSTTTQTKSKVQTSSSQFGIKAGVNIANIHVDDGTEWDSKAGFHVGVLDHIHLSEYLAVQPELMFSTEGAEAGVLKLRRNYINLPVLVQLMVADGLRLQAGPQAAFLISAKDKNGNVEVNVKDNLKTVNFAVAFGVSYLSKAGLGIDARYNLGLSNLNESETAPKIRNRVWQIGAFYQFSH